MPVINEWDVQGALVEIAEADAGPGGLVELHGGYAHPLVEWGDEGMARRPITALELEVLRRSRGTKGPVSGPVRLNAFVAAGAGGLESRILDRFEEVLTTAALKARGIDARIAWGGRLDLTELERPGGGKRRALEGEITFTRK